MKHYYYEPGEVRFVWLDEDGQRTSQHHKTVESAYTYRAMLLRHLKGERVFSVVNKRTFEPQGSGKAPVRLVRWVFGFTQEELADDNVADVEAIERLAAAKQRKVKT